MPIFRPLASLVWEEMEVPYRQGASRHFASSHNEIFISSLASYGRDRFLFVIVFRQS